MFRQLLRTPNDGVLALLRLVLGIIFFAHGAQLVLGWFGGYGFAATMKAFTGMGIPAPFAALAILTEFLGGAALIVGFLTRIAALGILITMLVAVVKVHLAVGFFMNWYGSQKGEGYEYHLLAMAISLALVIRGAGAASVDQALSGAQRYRRGL